MSIAENWPSDRKLQLGLMGLQAPQRWKKSDSPIDQWICLWVNILSHDSLKHVYIIINNYIYTCFYDWYYIYMCVYMYIHIYMYNYIYICIYMYIYIYIYIWFYLILYVYCVCICIYIYIVYLCLFVFIAYIYISTKLWCSNMFLNFTILTIKRYIVQCEAPKIAKLVYNSNNYGLWYL